MERAEGENKIIATDTYTAVGVSDTHRQCWYYRVMVGQSGDLADVGSSTRSLGSKRLMRRRYT